MTAPSFRTVDALTGTKAPTAFFRALSEADAFCAEVDKLQDVEEEYGELRARLDEALAEIGELRRNLAVVRNERDSLRAAVTAAL